MERIVLLVLGSVVGAASDTVSLTPADVLRDATTLVAPSKSRHIEHLKRGVKHGEAHMREAKAAGGGHGNDRVCPGTRCISPAGLDWIGKHKVGVCACPKCGTTAIYQGIFKALLHRDPFGEANWGFIQDLGAKEWEGTFSGTKPDDFFIKGHYGNETAKHDGYAIAFVREPVSRLISAWKDKMSCGLWVPWSVAPGDGPGDKWFHATGERVRKDNIKLLLDLEGKGRKASSVHSHTCPDKNYGNANYVTHFNNTCTYNHCLSLDEFAKALLSVHEQGKQGQLNVHVMPQTHFCFANGATPDKWDKVTTGYDTAAIEQLGKRLGGKIGLEGAKHGQSHSTADAMLNGRTFKVPSSVLNQLAKVTKAEDRMLHKYYDHKKSTLMGRDFEHFIEQEPDAPYWPSAQGETLRDETEQQGHGGAAAAAAAGL